MYHFVALIETSFLVFRPRVASPVLTVAVSELDLVVVRERTCPVWNPLSAAVQNDVTRDLFGVNSIATALLVYEVTKNLQNTRRGCWIRSWGQNHASCIQN